MYNKGIWYNLIKKNKEYVKNIGIFAVSLCDGAVD